MNTLIKLSMLISLVLFTYPFSGIAKEGHIIELVKGEKVLAETLTKENGKISYTNLEGYPGLISIEKVSNIQQVKDIDSYAIETKKNDQKNTKKELNLCLENIGQDVITKNFSEKTFPGNKCGVTRWGRNGIGLNIYNSFYQNNIKELDYMLQSLEIIAKRYGYTNYAILISDNENKLMIDREIQNQRLQ